MSACSGNVTSNVSSSAIQDLEFIAYGVISPAIIAMGIFGDLMTIFVLTHPLLRKASIVYTYLTALAATDLLTLISIIPMLLMLVGVKSCSWGAAVYYAHVGFPLANALMAASVWIVTFLTLAQYVAICHPFLRRFRSRSLAMSLTAAAYAASLLLHVPWSLRKSVFANAERGSDCAFVACDNSWGKLPIFTAYSVGRELFSRIVPCALLCWFNFRIFLTYRRMKKERMRRVATSQRGAVEERGEREERRLWQLLLAIVAVFFICTIPAVPPTIFVKDDLDTHFPFQLFRAVTNVLEFTKFTLNFYFYCMVNPDIRTLALKRLTCQEIARPATAGATGNNVRLSSLVQSNGRSSNVGLSHATSSTGGALSRASESSAHSGLGGGASSVHGGGPGSVVKKRSATLPSAADRAASLRVPDRRLSRESPIAEASSRKESAAAESLLPPKLEGDFQRASETRRASRNLSRNSSDHSQHSQQPVETAALLRELPEELTKEHLV